MQAHTLYLMVFFYQRQTLITQYTVYILSSVTKLNELNKVIVCNTIVTKQKKHARHFGRGITHQLPRLIDSSDIIYTISEDQHKCQMTKMKTTVPTQNKNTEYLNKKLH